MRAQEKAGLKTNGKTSHETSVEMVSDCLALVPYSKDDVLLDAGSGKNKVWFNAFNCKEKYEYEIEDGKDFLTCKQEADWIIGNPPYHISWLFTEKALLLARKGVAWLINLNNLNSLLTPRRLDFALAHGFEITTIHVLQDKRWFGRYFFIIYEKKTGILTWSSKNYGSEKGGSNGDEGNLTSDKFPEQPKGKPSSQSPRKSEQEKEFGVANLRKLVAEQQDKHMKIKGVSGVRRGRKPPLKEG